MNWEVWGPPFVVVALGLVAGLVLVMRGRRGAPTGAAAGAALTRDDLLTRKDALVDELRGLEAERTKVEAEQFEARWRDTLTRAATALRDLEQYDLGPLDTEEVAAEAAASVEGVTFGRFGWAAGVVVFFVVLGLTLTEASKPRSQGDSVTGATVDQREARLEGLEARLAADPTDVDAAAELAHAAIRSGDLEAGMKFVEVGRQASPDDPRIQASLAALMLVIGYDDRAETILDQVLGVDPANARAWLWQGVLSANRGEVDAGKAAFAKVLELSDDAEDRRLAAAMMADASGTPSGPPSATAPSATVPSATAGARVTGRVTLADGASAPAGALVFIYARATAEGRGAPLAALRLPASGLPLDFELGDRDMVMGGASWPDQVWLTARIDTDGDAMTHEDGAPLSSPVGPVSGTDPVELVLR